MVNLPPHQPDQSDRQPVEGGRSPRPLAPDELLAVVLAFLGIGFILWWGLARSQGPFAQSSLLERRESGSNAIVAPTPGDQAEMFEPRRSEPSQRSRQIPAVATPPPAVLRGQGQAALGPEPAAPDPTPVVPTTTPEAERADTTQPLDISAVPTTHWAYPFIKPMFDQGYLPDLEESRFQPDQPVSRAELAAMLSQAFSNAPREGSVRSFSDVPGTYWAATAIDNAVAQNFMSGYAEGDFRPERAVPRYEVLVALATGLALPDSTTPDQTLQAFVDANSMPNWAQPKVAAALENALVVNYPARDQLKPTQAATRAEIVVMLHQALVQLGELPAVESQYAVP